MKDSSEATFCESVRQRSMEQQSFEQIMAKIEKIENSLNQITEILNKSKQ